jgi:methylmalonyl-CoA/ethylmalonyl-CoA epimerase
MSLSRIGQIALPVSDANRAEAFYGEALGLRKLFRFGELVFFDCAGVRLMLEGSPKTVSPGSGACHYFMVENIEAVAADLKSKQVAFEDEPHLVAKMPDHDLWMTFFRDPDGHLLALMEEKRN